MGAIWRELVAFLVLYIAFRFSPSLAVLSAVAVLLVLGLGADALLSVLAQEER